MIKSYTTLVRCKIEVEVGIRDEDIENILVEPPTTEKKLIHCLMMSLRESPRLSGFNYQTLEESQERSIETLLTLKVVRRT